MENTIEIHDLGFVKLLDVMGDDQEVENAARISYGEGTRKVSQTRNLIRYLMRHKHTSPFEMCEVKFHLKLPIFVMRQLVRHRTANLNEYSGRYSVMSDEFYLPEGDYLAKQSTTNNQGRGGSLKHSQGLLQFEFNRIYDGAAMAYHVLLENELSREVARAVLPVANYTECIWKIDLHNLMHFLSLRFDKHAQYEIRVYAELILKIMKKWVPYTYDAFVKHRLDGMSFSEDGLIYVRKLLSGVKNVSTKISQREKKEINKILEI